MPPGNVIRIKCHLYSKKIKKFFLCIMYSDVIVQSTVYVIFVLLKGCNVVHLLYHSDLTVMLNELQYVMLL
jgi:hypothetical protein